MKLISVSLHRHRFIKDNFTTRSDIANKCYLFAMFLPKNWHSSALSADNAKEAVSVKESRGQPKNGALKQAIEE